jgi:hypothetical protein
MALIGVAPCASAEPAGDDGTATVSPTLSLSDLGTSNSISFDVHRDSVSNTLSFPVPQGLAPVTLNATLETPIALRFGSLAVTQEGRTLGRIELPLQDAAPLSIPLAGATVYGNFASVTLTVTALPIEGYCWDPATPIRLTNGSISFDGTAQPPANVATFLPPLLRTLTIAMPAKPSQSESDAAVVLSTGIARRYSGQNLQVVVVPLADGATTLATPSAPFERQIIVKEGPDKGVSLQPTNGMPALLISGRGGELTNQTRLLADDSLQFALSPQTVAGPLSIKQELVSDTTTLLQLNKSGLKSEATWPKVGVEIDQTRFGHSIHGIRVHLNGSHTPVPAGMGGEVTVGVGGDVLARWAAEASGTIDRWIDIPDRLIGRTTVLDVSVHTTGEVGPCGDYLPIALAIDGSTQIEVNPANPPVPQGFRSLPQALMPGVKIGLGDDALGDTGRAIQLVMALQRSTPVPLTTTVTSLKQAIDSPDPAVLVSADGWPDKTIALPFSTDQGQVTLNALDADGKPKTLTLDPAVQFGSLQTVFDGKRSLLIATSNGAPAQLDELLRWLSGESGRLSGLNGRAVVSVPGSAPATIPNPPTDLAAAPEGSGPRSGLDLAWWIAGGVVAAAAAGALVIALRARRSHRTDDVAAEDNSPD